MPHSRTLLSTAFLVSMLLAPSVSHAALLDNNKVVRDERGQVVHALRSGTCVRTSWMDGRNVCAPLVIERKVVKAAYVVPPPQMVERPVEVLSAAERIVYFPFDSAELIPEAQQKLDSVAIKLSDANSVRGAKIVGYADRLGANNYNQTLSERRAMAVKDYLARRGYLNTEVARVRGVGESAPVAHCNPRLPRGDQIACLGPDRKVELEVQYTETKLQRTLVQPAAYAPLPPGDVIYTQPAEQPDAAFTYQ